MRFAGHGVPDHEAPAYTITVTPGRKDLDAGVLRKLCRRGAGPQAALDGDTTEVFARKLLPGETLKPIGDGDLSYTNPPDNEIYAGCFGDVSVVAAAEFERRHAFK